MRNTDMSTANFKETKKLCIFKHPFMLKDKRPANGSITAASKTISVTTMGLYFSFQYGL